MGIPERLREERDERRLEGVGTEERTLDFSELSRAEADGTGDGMGNVA